MPETDGQSGGKKRKVKRVKVTKHANCSGATEGGKKHHSSSSNSKFVFDAINKDGDEYNFIPYKQFLAIDAALDKVKKTGFTKAKATKLAMGTPLLLCFNKEDGSVSNYQISYYICYDKGEDIIYTSRVPPLMVMALYYAVLPNNRGNVGISGFSPDKVCAEKSYILDV